MTALKVPRRHLLDVARANLTAPLKNRNHSRLVCDRSETVLRADARLDRVGVPVAALAADVSLINFHDAARLLGLLAR